MGRGAVRARAGAALRRPRRARDSSRAKADGARGEAGEFANAVSERRGRTATAAGSRSAATPSRRSCRFTGRSSSRRCSSARTRGSTRSSATRRSWGGTRISNTLGRRLPRLAARALHEDAHGNADLVAHFFRRAFDLLRDGRRLRPDRDEHDRARATRARPACAGSASTAARSSTRTRRVKWPGARGSRRERRPRRQGQSGDQRASTDGEVAIDHRVPLPRGGHDDPARLQRTRARAFEGSDVFGMGFTFDDNDTKASPRPSPRCDG